ncbi:MAG: PilZ domain-containing protein [Desulforhopalus sp.]
MAKSKADWDKIPSIDGLSVDWEYEPESPLGKRELVRIETKDLRTLFSVKSIPVKVAVKGYEGKGYLVDIAEGGCAVLLGTELSEGQPVKLGLFLGEQKVLSRAIVRSVRQEKGGYRTGMEFVDLAEESATYIAGLVSSKVFKGM